MTLSYLLSPTFQFTNVSGKPLTDGYVNVYISGTRSKYYAFSDFDGTLHPFNIPLNALGSAVILVSPAHSYDIYVYNSVGTLQMSRYNITPATGEGTVITDVTTLNSKDGTVDITANSSTEYDLSIATKIAELKEYTDQAKNDAIESANTSIANLDANKKDKQNELNFNGSATKTVKKITQDANGELNVEFEDIDLPGYSISSSDGSINVSTSESVTDLTLPNDVVRDSAYTHIDAATANPLMDGTAAVGISTKYAREDHVHPSDTSKEDIANKTTVVLGTSDSKYPTDKAVAEFVNSSIATNTANYISNNGEPFTSVEQLEAYSGTVTNNDYAFVTGTDSEGNTYYDRYKATVKGSSVTWALEYRLNNSSFTAAQWSAINSGITSALVAKIHEHENKAVLDGITSTDVANWNSKQNSLKAGDNITIDGSTISSDQVFVATYGTTTYQEIKDAYNVGKICTVYKGNLYYYITDITTERIMFGSLSISPNIYTVTVTSDNKWSVYNSWLQPHLTFDTTPTSGSTNPVTSDGINTAINAKANVQADWNITNSSSGAFIKNKPYYTKYTTTATYYKVCSFPVTNSDSVDISGIQILARYFSGGVNGRLIYKNEFRLYYERVSDVYANTQFLKFYYVINGSKIDLYAQRNGYPTLHVAPLVNQPKSRVDFTDFGTEVPSLPEGATEITPVWVANSVRSSGTAPVRVNAFGDLTPVPMDSIPTASSTNLMTSGSIKTAIDTVNAKGLTVKEISGEQVICFE